MCFFFLQCSFMCIQFTYILKITKKINPENTVTQVHLLCLTRMCTWQSTHPPLSFTAERIYRDANSFPHLAKKKEKKKIAVFHFVCPIWPSFVCWFTWQCCQPYTHLCINTIRSNNYFIWLLPWIHAILGKKGTFSFSLSLYLSLDTLSVFGSPYRTRGIIL